MNITRAVIVAATSTVLVGIAALPAAAEPTHGKDNYVTFYEDTDFKGHTEARSSYDSDFGNDRYGGINGNAKSFNDATSSISNRTGSYWYLYKDKKYKGDVVCIRPNSEVSNLKRPRINDWISSAKKAPSTNSGCGGVYPVIGG